MAGPWEDFASGPKPEGGPWEDYPPPPEGAFKRAGRILTDPEGGAGAALGSLIDRALPQGGPNQGWLGDTAIDLARAPISSSQTIAGLANLASAGQAGKLLDTLGYNPKETQDFLAQRYSPSRKAQQQEVANASKAAEDELANANGAWGTTKAAASGAGRILGSMLLNPGTIQEQVIQSAPDMLMGAGVVGKVAKGIAAKSGAEALDAAANKLSWLGHGIEGAQSAGQNAEQIRESNPDNLAGQYLQVPAGILTGLIGRGAAKVPGFGDVQTAAQLALAGPKGASKLLAGSGGVTARLLKAGFSEGFLQELPQSYQEQIWQNLAEGKPWNEGALTQGVQGAMTGFAMGLGEGSISGKHTKPAGATPPAVAPDIAGANQANAALGAAVDQYSGIPGVPRLEHNPLAPDGSVIAMPAPGSLADAAATAHVTGATPAPVAPSLLVAYPNLQAAKTALAARPDADLMTIIPHPEDKAEFALVPKTQGEIDTIQSQQRAQQAAQTRQEQLASEEEASRQDANTRKTVLQLYREAGAVEKTIGDATPPAAAKAARAHAADLRAQAVELAEGIREKALNLSNAVRTRKAETSAAGIETRGRRVFELIGQAKQAAAAGDAATESSLMAQARELYASVQADHATRTQQLANEAAQSELAPVPAQPLGALPGMQRANQEKAAAATVSAQTRQEQLASEEEVGGPEIPTTAVPTTKGKPAPKQKRLPPPPVSDLAAADAAQDEIARSTGAKFSQPRLARLPGETDAAYLQRRAAQANAARAGRVEQRKLPTREGDQAGVREALSLPDGAPVSILSADTRPDAGEAKGVSKQAATFITHVAKVFGKRAVFFDVPDRGAAEGFYVRGNTIYLNVNSSTQHLRVLGHELTHAMKRQAGEAYQQMLDAVAVLRTDAEMAAQFKDYFGKDLEDPAQLDQPHAGSNGTLREFLAEEWMADLSGNRFAEGEFWTQLFATLEAQHGGVVAKGIIARLRLAVVAALNKLKALIGGNAFAVDARLAQHLEGIRNAVATGFAEYARLSKAGQLAEAVGEAKFSGKSEQITVNGTARPVLNDQGRAIHPTPEGVRNFWKWYANSNLLDEQGRPMVLYHGTEKDIKRFKASKTGMTGAGVYLTPDTETADAYAGASGLNMPVYARGKYIGLMAWSKLVQDQGGWAQARAEAERQGIAGVWDQKYENAINVFDPGNIKSAIGNSGAFSGQEIHRSTQRAAPPDSRLFFEVAPDPRNAKLKTAWDQLTPKDQTEISQTLSQRIIPKVLAALGAKGRMEMQLGGWMDDTSPSFALVLEQGDAGKVAKAIGHVLSQEAMYVMSLKSFTGGVKSGILEIDVGADASPAEIHAVYQKVRALSPETISGHSTIGGVMHIGVPLEGFASLGFRANALLGNQYHVGHGEGYSAEIKEEEYGYATAQGSLTEQRLRERGIVDSAKAEAEQLFRSELADRGIKFSPGRHDTRSDAAGDRRLGGNGASGLRRQVLPESVSAVGVHYSKQQRERLDSSYFGTGIQGAEVARVRAADDPRIQQRIYFYVNSGRPIKPEEGVGSHAHQAQLDNLYDYVNDPLDLRVTNTFSGFESAVLDRGFDGAINSESGIAVLLGKRNIPVEYLGQNDRPEVPPAEKAEPSEYGKQLRAVAANKALPAGEMTGADWKRLMPRLMPDIDVSHLDDGQKYYKNEIVPRPESAKLSPPREDELSESASPARTFNRAELQALRRAAAGLERPRAGVFLRVTEDGKAVATGPKGTRIPDTFHRFAHENGLTFYAGRELPDYGQKPAGDTNELADPHAGAAITRKTEPMPIAYRESGALYFGEMGGDSLDRTDKTRFSPARFKAEEVRDDQGRLLAPNGQRSKLNEDQWHEVRSPEFKAWFGDWEAAHNGKDGNGVWGHEAVSKVVDENGEPLVVYHGTEQGGFTVFDPYQADKRRSPMIFAAATRNTASTYSGQGDEIYFSEVPNTIEGFEEQGYMFDEEDGFFSVRSPDGYKLVEDANREDALAEAREHAFASGPEDDQLGVYSLFLNIRNPNEAAFEGASWDGTPPYGAYSVYDVDAEESVYSEDGRQYLTEDEAKGLAENAPDRYEIRPAEDRFETTNTVAEEALRYGNDGAIIRRVIDDGGKSSGADPDDVFVFFKANQAKSATQNTGSFSRINDDLRYSLKRVPPELLSRIDVSSFGWHEQDDEYVYHVTSGTAAKAALRSGLVPGKPSLFPSSYASHVKGRIFFTERSGVKFWEGRVEDALFDRYDDPPPVAVLRAPKASLTLLPDALGTQDSGHDASYVQFSPPRFFSQLARAVENAPVKLQTQPAAQWRLWLANQQSIKKDELMWSGVLDWLMLQGKDSVSRERIQEYLTYNGVRVKDVVLGKKRITVEPLLTESDITVTSENEHQWRLSAPSGRTVLVGKGTVDKEEAPAYGARYFNRLIRERNQAAEENQGRPNFGKWQLPGGGQNYRELLITLPEDPPMFSVFDGFQKVGADFTSAKDVRAWARSAGVSGSIRQINTQKFGFKSGHFDQPNILAHLRFNDRFGADGSPVLFLEEIQSDWGQRGRDEGFKGMGLPIDTTGWKVIVVDDNDWHFQRDVRIVDADGNTVSHRFGARKTLSDADLIADAAKSLEISRNDGKVPTGPFVQDTKSWTALALKRTIMWAAQHGYSKVAWTTGEQQARRYDLSKSVDHISWRTNGSTGRTITIELPEAGTAELLTNEKGFVVGASGARNMFLSAEGKPLSDVVGTEIAKLVASEKSGTLEGQGLQIGGGGMRTFYDQIVPSVANDLLRKVGGGKVETVKVDLGDYGRTGRTAEKAKYAEFSGQMGFTITPEMAAKVTGEGLPLFSPQRLSEEFETSLQAHFRAKQPGPVKLSGNTPAALQLFGWKDLPTVVDPNVIDKMHFDHGMTVPQMARLPFLLKRPLMIFADNSNKSLVFVGEHLAPGKIALVAIKPEISTGDKAERYPSNMVVTGYAPQTGWAEVAKRVMRGELVYRDTTGAIPEVIRGALISAQKKYAQVGRGLPRELLQGSASRTYGDSSEKAQSGTRSPTVSAARSVLERAYSVLGQSALVKLEGEVWPDGAKFSPSRSTLGNLTPAQEAAAEHVLGAPKTLLQRLADFKKDWAKNLQQGIFDQFAPIAELDPKAYIQARLSKGGESTLEALMLYGKVFVGADGGTDVRYTKAGGMQGFASKMADLKGEHDRFFLWVAAQRADRLKGIGLENLFSQTDIAELKTLNQGAMKDGTQRPLLYVRALQDLNEFNDNVLKVAVDSGLIDDATRRMYKDTPYVPFYRLQEDDSVNGFGIKAGLVNQYAWKKLKGGTDKLNQDLLANMLHNWSHLITASAKNRAAKATLDAAVIAGIAAQIPAGAPGKGHVSYKESGAEKVFVVSDPHLMDAVAALHYAGLGPWAKPLSTMKHWLTIGVTANPAFKLRNLIRDSIQSIGSADMSYNVGGNVLQGWKATAQDSETRAHLLASGGMIRFGSMLDGKDSQRAQDLINQGVAPDMILDSDSKIKNFWKRYMHPALEAYNEIGDRSEQINRAALYEQLVAKGLTHTEAAYWARDLMDFSMSGKWTAIRTLTQTVPFFNARLQGLYKLGRAGKQDIRRLGTVLGATALASLALLLAYQDDEDWKRRSDSDRNNYWWFKVGGHAFRLPKPFEIGAIATLAERGYEVTFDPEMTGKRFGKNMSDLVLQQLSMNPTPQLFKPLMDIYANKDAFTGRDIESMADQKLRKQDRYDEKTSELARFLGGLGLPDPTQLAMGRWETLSPKQFDFLARGYFSWLATMTTTAIDYGIRPMLDRGARPDRQLKDIFFVGNFVETLPSNSSRYLQQMYDQAREIEQAYQSYHHQVKLGNVEAAKTLFADEQANIIRYQPTEAMKRAGSLMNVQLQRISASTTLSGEEKRLRLDQIYARKNQLAQAFRAQ